MSHDALRGRGSHLGTSLSRDALRGSSHLGTTWSAVVLPFAVLIDLTLSVMCCIGITGGE